MVEFYSKIVCYKFKFITIYGLLLLIIGCGPATKEQACEQFCGQIQDDLADIALNKALNCGSQSWGDSLDGRVRFLCSKSNRSKKEQQMLNKSLKRLKYKKISFDGFAISWRQCKCTKK